MIYTVTINPSIDYYMYLDDFRLGKTNRSSNEVLLFGGKGFNVSRMLNVMNQDNTAYGYVAGDVGLMFERLLRKTNISYKLFKLDDGQTRINVKLNEIKETEINASGPKIFEENIQELMVELKKLHEGDVLIVSGSIGKNCEDNLYKRILNCVDSNVLTFVDTSSRPLLFSLQSKPFLIKPNYYELQQVYSHPIKTDLDLIQAMKSLQINGARNILVSLGKQGACLLCENGRMYMASAKQEKVINTIGAGDCMLAGFVSSYLQTKDLRKALLCGVACGSAKAYTKDLPNKLQVKEVLMHTTIKAIL